MRPLAEADYVLKRFREGGVTGAVVLTDVSQRSSGFQ